MSGLFPGKGPFGLHAVSIHPLPHTRANTQLPAYSSVMWQKPSCMQPLWGLCLLLMSWQSCQALARDSFGQGLRPALGSLSMPSMTPCWRVVVLLLGNPTSSLSRRLGLAKVPQDVPAPDSRTKEELVFVFAS